MPRYSTGQPVRLSATVRDFSDALVDPGTLTLTIQKPDATQQSYPSPVKDSTGAYHQDVPVTDLGTVGHYQYKWTSTGAGAGESFGDFDVFDPFEPAVLPLQDARAALNIRAGDTSNDDEIQQYIATITSNIESMTGGPLINRTVIERAEMVAGQTAILVRARPLVSVTQILNAAGSAIDISAGLDIDANAGIIRRRLGLPFFGPFFSWLPQCTVIAVAGWGTAVPAAFNTAARIILQNLWETQHGPSGRPSMAAGEDMVTLPGFGFAIPNQAAELLNGSQDNMPFMNEAYL